MSRPASDDQGFAGNRAGDGSGTANREWPGGATEYAQGPDNPGLTEHPITL